MRHVTDGFVKPVGQWDCLVIDGRSDGFLTVTDRLGRQRRVPKEDVEPYPAYVMATEDFFGGQRFEIFEVTLEPWETLEEDVLVVRSINGSMVRLPVSKAQPSARPVSSDVPVAV